MTFSFLGSSHCGVCHCGSCYHGAGFHLVCHSGSHGGQYLYRIAGRSVRRVCRGVRRNAAVMLPLAKRRTMRQLPITNGSPLTIGSRGIVLRKSRRGISRVRVDGRGIGRPARWTYPAAKRCTLRSKTWTARY